LPTDPFALGYRMPAEWEKHEATWLTWPKDRNTFPGKILDDVEQIYLRIIEELAKGERVDLIVDDLGAEKRVAAMIRNLDNVAFHHIRTADVWVRDYGPIFVKNSSGVATTKWTFNAWGNKYDELKKDNETGKAICNATKLTTFEPGIVLEGGSVDVNGHGTALVTETLTYFKTK